MRPRQWKSLLPKISCFLGSPRLDWSWRLRISSALPTSGSKIIQEPNRCSWRFPVGVTAGADDVSGTASRSCYGSRKWIWSPSGRLLEISVLLPPFPLYSCIALKKPNMSRKVRLPPIRLVEAANLFTSVSLGAGIEMARIAKPYILAASTPHLWAKSLFIIIWFRCKWGCSQEKSACDSVLFIVWSTVQTLMKPSLFSFVLVTGWIGLRN